MHGRSLGGELAGPQVNLASSLCGKFAAIPPKAARFLAFDPSPGHHPSQTFPDFASFPHLP